MNYMDFNKARLLLGENFSLYLEEIRSTIESLKIETESKALDIGTGKGKMAIILALMGYQVISGEPEGDNWADWKSEAKKVGVLDKINFQPFKAENLPFDDNSFDLITALGTFHHLSDIPKAIAECLRVIKPHGYIVIFEFSSAGIERIRNRHPGHPPAIDLRDYYNGPVEKMKFIPQGEINTYIFQKWLNSM